MIKSRTVLFSEPYRGEGDSGYSATLGFGERLSIIPPDAYTGVGRTVLSITYRTDRQSFYANKLHNGADPLGDAEDMVKLHRLEGMAVPLGGGEDVCELLLGPSIVGPGLYGSSDLLDIETGVRFGRLRMAGPPNEQRARIDITMPYPTYRSMSRLIIERSSVTDPPDLPVWPPIFRPQED